MKDRFGRHNQLDIEIENMRKIMLENESELNNEITRLRGQLEEWQKRYRIVELSLSEARGKNGNINSMNQTEDARRELDMAFRSSEQSQ
jgi:hypothetical protein